MGKLYLLVLAFLLPAMSHAQIIWDFSSATPLVTHADGPYVIQILDPNGTLVKQLSGLPGTPVITVGLVRLRGIYTVKVTTATSIATAKLIVL